MDHAQNNMPEKISRKPSRAGAHAIPAGLIEGINAALRQQYRAYQAQPLPPVLVELTRQLARATPATGDKHE